MNITSKRSMYLMINPLLEKIKIYNSTEIPEWKRITVTRFRLSSHRLKVETGRWSRLPREERKCQCTQNEIQDETHVVFKCELSQRLRNKYELNYTSFDELFRSMPVRMMGNFFYELLQIYE